MFMPINTYAVYFVIRTSVTYPSLFDFTEIKHSQRFKSSTILDSILLVGDG